MKQINEEILDAWLELNHVIDNEKIVSQLPYNEILIYRYLYQRQTQEVTATQLCQAIGMLKSQMNRTLTAMEEKHLIHRIRSTQDKRQIFVSINKEHMEVYESEHTRILHIVDRLVERIGIEEAQNALSLFRQIAQIAKEEMK